MDIQTNIRMSFMKVRQDFEAIKRNVTDWIFSINTRQTELEYKVKVLEARIKQLEQPQFRNYGGQNGRIF